MIDFIIIGELPLMKQQPTYIVTNAIITSFSMAESRFST